MKLIHLSLGVVGTLVLGTAGVVRFQEVQDAVDRLEDRRRVTPDEVDRLAAELEGLHGDLEQVNAELADEREQSAEQLAAARRTVQQLEASLERARLEIAAVVDGLEAQAAHLDELAAVERLDPSTVEARFQAIDSEITTSWSDLRNAVQTASTRAAESLAELEELRGHVSRDLDRMWVELVAPVVQLAGDSSVGSGVLLESRPTEDPEVFETYVLTAWHVVRDIQGSSGDRDVPVPVRIYSEESNASEETATLLAHDRDLDVALLLMDSDQPFARGARLAPLDEIEATRIFDPIYAVGCPLGNDPIPTSGEIAATRHEVDGSTYWMINAPTYIGNSGGGIFLADSHELAGIFSKIYNYGSLRPTIVPHMGLATSLELVYPWLEEVGHGELIPASAER